MGRKQHAEQPKTSGWEWPGESAGKLAWLSDIKTPGWVQTRCTTTTTTRLFPSAVPDSMQWFTRAAYQHLTERHHFSAWSQRSYCRSKETSCQLSASQLSNCKMQNPLILNMGTMTSRQTSYSTIPEKQHSWCMIRSQHCDYFLSSNEKGILFQSIIREKVLCNWHVKAVAYLSEEMTWGIFIFETSK